MGKEIYRRGIDISTHNGKINLEPYKDQFVIIRAGYGTHHVDDLAFRNMDECERLGIPYGVYWYSYALNVEEAKIEAKACLNTIKGRNISVGVWFDMEDADGYKNMYHKINANLITDMCNSFCEAIEAAGYYAGIYSSKDWFNRFIKCPKYDKWVASWGSDYGELQTDTSDMGSIQQYTTKPLDKDVLYAPLSTFSIKNVKSIDELAHEVIEGKWGNGSDRKVAMALAGYDYDRVQIRVNEILEVSSQSLHVGSNVMTIAKGNAASDGSGHTAKSGMTGTVTNVISDAKYPFLISNNNQPIGWYTKDALKIV